MATLKNTTISGTEALTLPTGTTAERPGSLVAGMIRHNSTSNSVEFYNGSTWVVYHSGVTATGGNDIYDLGPFRIHVFTGIGNFVVSAPGSVDVLLVAGGGGGAAHVPGGGGAGGLIYRPGLAVTAQTYAI